MDNQGVRYNALTQTDVQGWNVVYIRGTHKEKENQKFSSAPFTMPLAVYSKHNEPRFSLFFHEFKILFSHALKAVNDSQFRLSPLSLFVSCSFLNFFDLIFGCGPVAQRIRRLPTEQEIPSSIPGRIVTQQRKLMMSEKVLILVKFRRLFWLLF